MKILIYLLITTLGFANISPGVLNREYNIKAPIAIINYEANLPENQDSTNKDVEFNTENPYWETITFEGQESLEFQTVKGKKTLVVELPKDYVEDQTIVLESKNIKDIEIKTIEENQYLYLEHEEDRVARVYRDTLDPKIFHISISKIPNPYRYRVVLDPGHGGFDHGASYNGAKEKDIVLDIALRMEHKLKDLGVDVKYTRDKDQFIVLEQRPQISNQIKPDAFVSIHNNANTSRYVRGNGTYIYTDNNRSVKEKIALANSIQKSLEKEFPDWKSHGVIKENFCVTRNTISPSALVELGFLSNSTDRQLLQDATVRDKGADAITKGIYEFLDNK